ncbi:hypothetical protein KFE98_15815 [bacterium SCSIO 12741]|nr:hypothetical protein KFE98_15815 [bacterium SCSIO 12741]
MMMIRIIGIALFAALFAACGTSTTPESTEKDSEILKKEAIASIKDQESKLLNSVSGQIDVNQANKVVSLYIQFANNNADDENAPEFLFKAAEVCMGISAFDRSINILKNFDRDYGNHEKAVDALYLTAFIYDNYLNQKGMAETKYRELIQRFPRHEYAIQAQASIKNLHMTDEELIERFEQMNKEDSLPG